MAAVRKRIFELVEPTHDKHDLNYFFDLFIIILILLNVFAMIIASEPEIGNRYRPYFYSFEVFSVIVFSIEYILRLWTCVEQEKYSHPVWGRIKYMFSPAALIDFFAILPFYLPFVGIDLRFIRMLRLFRIFRLLKMARYSSAFNMLKGVFKEKKEELLVTLLLIIIILVIISTLMHYVERGVQPEAFGSIPRALWWGVVTLTTVGYGDVYPITTFGKILGGIITLMGIGLIALPSGILASGYTEQIQIRKRKKSIKKKSQQKNPA